MSGALPYDDAMVPEAYALTRTLIPRVNAFRRRQRDDGTVAAPSADAARELTAVGAEGAAWLRSHGRAEQADALTADVADWVAAGLDTPPHFARSRDALAAPPDGGWAAFLAPVHTTNSVPPVGSRLEFFLVRRREPDALGRLARDFPHPKNNCQATVLLAGSDGFARGNCLVFFPENVAAHDKVRGQAYAIFFFSKFRRIHETYALPSAEAVLTPDSVPRSSQGLDPETCYQARALWGYLHDYFHHQGPWPLDQHVKLKMNWFIGVLEELKVDARTALACAADGVPHGSEQIDMILLERVFRYPLADDAQRSFDAATGVFLFSWLRERDALTPEGGALRLHRPRVLAALRELADAVAELEAAATTPRAYRSAAKALVRTLLPEGADGDRYRFTGEQRVLRTVRASLASAPALAFTPAER
ncbi:DUF6421 family protein [Streptomyces boncukensis]|uniref:Uncharacterized protein n=1 Tax=Streptomyces boncukensis TaxID=2711219 RepID=A0A6G4WX22_9ACTN|nr:DUF6421 family protein [Streptomyces boncukensis]NGO69563.1 hypothetical protein [Streptomyces boncukensis]